MSECFQRQSWKNFEFCSHKNCTLTTKVRIQCPRRPRSKVAGLSPAQHCTIPHKEASEGSGEEVPTSSTSCLISMTAVGSFRWGSEAGTAVGEAWGQELDEEDGVKDEDTFMARQVQIFEADEAEREAVEWLAANSTQYEPEDSGSSVDVDRTVDLFDLADCM